MENFKEFFYVHHEENDLREILKNSVDILIRFTLKNSDHCIAIYFVRKKLVRTKVVGFYFRMQIFKFSEIFNFIEPICLTYFNECYRTIYIILLRRKVSGF